MKKIISLFILIFAFSVVNAQSMKVYLPEWKTNVCPPTDNFSIPYSATFDGNRTTSNKSQTLVTAGKYYKYPALLPLLLVVDVSEGVNEVMLNIAGNNTSIINVPKGASFIDKNNVLLPVLKSPQNVVVEDPYIVFHGGEHVGDWSEYDSRPFRRSTFFDNSKNEEGFDKQFTIGAGRTFVVLMGLKPEKINFVISSKENSSNEQTVVGYINFFNKNEIIRCNGGNNVLAILGGPSNSPISFTNNDRPKVDYSIEVQNRGESTVSTKDVLIKLQAEKSSYSKTKNWWDDENGFKIYQLSQESGKVSIEPGETIKFQVSVYINTDVVKHGTGSALTSRATILYPTSPDSGKSTEFDLSYVYSYIAPPPPPPAPAKELTGIRTTFYQNDYVIVNTGRNPEQVLTIISPEKTDIEGGKTLRIPSSTKYIKYHLWNNDDKLPNQRLPINQR